MKMQSTHLRRAKRVRSSIKSADNRPRLSVYRSDAHIWAQIIDDTRHITLASATDMELKGTKTEKAIAVGAKIAEAAKKVGVTTIVFDRGSYRYHGRIKALADAARSSGLIF